MKNLAITLMLVVLLVSCDFTRQPENIVTTDIDNFWMAYDAVITTKDSTKQQAYLKELFLEKGTPGLEAIMQARRYTPQSYLDAINNHPLFWESMRENMEKAKDLGGEMETGINQLRKLYPELKPAKVYFTVGAFKTNGTTLDSLVLIGSELALADSTTVSKEFSEKHSHLKPFFASNPRKNIVFLNVHEFVHTQQKNAVGSNLLARCLHEGVAEFIAEQATEQPSPNYCISFGKANNFKVRDAFEKEMFSPYIYNWLMNDFNNEFQQRDLGYYIGYAIANNYFLAAPNKSIAIKEMIELDYTDEYALEQFIDKTSYFSRPLSELKEKFEKSRPTATILAPFENGDQNVDPNTKIITLKFSSRMDKNSRGFELGPLGADNVLSVKKVIGYNEDGTQFSFEVEMKPNKHYQVEASSSFMDANQLPLHPLLIDIRTSAN